MADESSNSPLGRMNRRTMLGTASAFIGGAVAGVTDVFGQERPPSTAPAVPAAPQARAAPTAPLTSAPAAPAAPAAG